MEFDILNEIITGSVARLFTDLSKHSNFMKTSSQMGQDKSEIPKQYDFYGGSTLSVDRQDTNKGPADNSVAEWLSGEAKVKL